MMKDDNFTRILSDISMSRRASFSRSSSKRSWASASIMETLDISENVFQRGNREEDDEKELKWAALERLPTYDRMRKARLKHVLDNDKIEYKDVDIVNLGIEEKRHIVKSLFNIIEDDNEKLLLKIRERSNRF